MQNDGKVRVVLKNKEGKVTRELFYPEKNAKKLVDKKSGWVIDEKTPVGQVAKQDSQAKPEPETDKNKTAPK